MLTTPTMESLVGVVGGQHLEAEIGCPPYLIGVTGEGAVRLRQGPENLSPCKYSAFAIAIMTFLHGYLQTMAKIPSMSWLSSQVVRTERMEPRRHSLPEGNTRFSIAMFEQMP